MLDHILDIIYKAPLKFFPPGSKKVTILKEVITKTIEPPPRKLLNEFFKNILSNYNNFESHGGFYKQINGCSMSSKLSPALANIFCSIFEASIIQKEISEGKIFCYVRYVDDIFCILKKALKLTFWKN